MTLQLSPMEDHPDAQAYLDRHLELTAFHRTQMPRSEDSANRALREVLNHHLDHVGELDAGVLRRARAEIDRWISGPSATPLNQHEAENDASDMMVLLRRVDRQARDGNAAARLLVSSLLRRHRLWGYRHGLGLASADEEFEDAAVAGRVERITEGRMRYVQHLDPDEESPWQASLAGGLLLRDEQGHPLLVRLPPTQDFCGAAFLLHRGPRRMARRMLAPDADAGALAVAWAERSGWAIDIDATEPVQTPPRMSQPAWKTPRGMTLVPLEFGDPK